MIVLLLGVIWYCRGGIRVTSIGIGSGNEIIKGWDKLRFPAQTKKNGEGDGILANNTLENGMGLLRD
jgi:hypothetical protein